MADSHGASPRRLAMNWLARREHTLAELRAKLEAREIPGDQIERTLAELTREGLASDARFAEAFTASRVRRGQGPVRIRAELVRRGVDSVLIASRLDDAAVDWVASARRVREKKFGLSRPRDFKERARQARFLQYRGFSSDQIRCALDTEPQP
jgi:regulatory protein